MPFGGQQARPNCLLMVGNDRTGFDGSQKCRGTLPLCQTRASAQCAEIVHCGPPSPSLLGLARASRSVDKMTRAEAEAIDTVEVR